MPDELRAASPGPEDGDMAVVSPATGSPGAKEAGPSPGEPPPATPAPSAALHEAAASGPPPPPAAASAGAATAISRAAAAAAAAAAVGGGDAGPPPPRPPCAFFLKTGTCAFGDRCKFSHPYDRVQPITFNSLGLPMRPGRKGGVCGGIFVFLRARARRLAVPVC